TEHVVFRGADGAIYELAGDGAWAVNNLTRAAAPPWLLHTGTPLGETGPNVQLEMADWNRDGRPDLVAIIKSGTGTHTTEVHILDAASAFPTWLLHTATPLPPTDGSYQLRLADWNRDGRLDLVAIRKGGGPTGSPELYVLDGAGNFQSWLARAGTPL